MAFALRSANMRGTPAIARFAAARPASASAAIDNKRCGILTPLLPATMLPQRLEQENGKADRVAPAGLRLSRTVAGQVPLICLARMDRSAVIASTAVIMSSAATIRNTAVQLPGVCFLYVGGGTPKIEPRPR